MGKGPCTEDSRLPLSVSSTRKSSIGVVGKFKLSFEACLWDTEACLAVGILHSGVFSQPVEEDEI